MATIDLTEVRRVMQLCRLGLTNEEQRRMQEQLSKIVSYVEKLNAVPTGDVAETHQVTDQANVTRADDVQMQPPDVVAGLLTNVPEREGRAISVKTVLTK